MAGDALESEANIASSANVALLLATSAARKRRRLAAIDDNASSRIIRSERHRDLVTEDDADSVLSELTAEVGEDLVSVLELDAEISRR
jgi:hypothetical protein